MKPLFFLIGVLFAMPVFSQIRIGPEVGYSRVSFTKDDIYFADYSRHTSPLGNGHAGITSSVPLSHHFSLQPSLLLVGKGSHYKEGGGFSGYVMQTDIKLWYAEVPVSILYSVAQFKELRLLAGAGAYVSAGLWGKTEGYFLGFDSVGMPGIFQGKNKVKFTSHLSENNAGRMNIKPIDAGGNLLVQAELKNIFLKISYSYGITKVIDPNYKNRVFALSAGYFFGTKKKADKKGK